MANKDSCDSCRFWRNAKREMVVGNCCRKSGRSANDPRFETDGQQ